MTLGEESIKLHAKLKGKMRVIPTIPITKNNLALLYTPGVASVARAIQRDGKKAYDYTWKGNSVAIVSNGTRLLGLGNCGSSAALSVMEGKAMIYAQYGSIDAVPLCIDAYKPSEIIAFVKQVAPTFGAINIEDIQTPEVFEIVDTLSRELDIPVFHDDQHGTAIVTTAALLNSLKIVGKKITDVKIVVSGAGSAGYGITLLLAHAGARNLTVVDRKGIIYESRTNLTIYKKRLAKITNRKQQKGFLKDAIVGADVFIGVSSNGHGVTQEMIASMNHDSIVFALSNPDPEILPSEAQSAGATITATGRSDFANPINNALVFPFFMKKILRERIVRLNEKLFYETALRIARSVKHPTKSKILPSLEEMKKVRL